MQRRKKLQIGTSNFRHLIDEYGIIMEIKQLDKEVSEKQITTHLDYALAQIQNNKYHKELEAQNVVQRLEMAILFVGKEAHLKYQFVSTESYKEIDGPS